MDQDSCFKGHAIVAGFGHLGVRITEQLLHHGCRVVVIDKDPADSVTRQSQELGFTLVRGDVRDDNILKEAGIEAAGCFISATGDDQANLEAAIDARQLNPTVPITLRLYDQGLARRVESAFDIHALSASFLASPAFVSAATEDSIVSVFDVDGQHLGIYCGTCSDGEKNGGICVIKEGESIRIATPGEEIPDSAHRLYAVLNEDRKRKSRLKQKRKKPENLFKRIRDVLSHLHPVSLMREALSIWSHGTVITRSLITALLFVGLTSIVVFTLLGHMHLLDAIYFVVTTMTTTGYGDINLQNASPGLKMYGVLMMIAGAGLMATIYAIIADYVLTARMEYLLGRREVNLRDHTVVVGLGNVGYRVAHDLRSLGIDVVAIEANEDSDNLSAARLMFPVIVGDASRASVLQKAGIDRASTILALTDDPMLNLGVALRAKEANRTVKTIARTYELGLADKLKHFGLDEVISTSAIAAPVFVDSAMFPGIQGSFKCDGDTIIVACRTVTDKSRFAGKSVKTVGEEAGIAVIMIADNLGAKYHLASPETILNEGCVAVVFLTRTKLPENDCRERC